jgi:tRNA threonylcarbamoyladenosine biosynthesis protein TsaE
MRSRSPSPAHTQAFAVEVARAIRKAPRRKHATVLALRGDLGSGKTTFTQAFLRAFGVRRRVTSATFDLMQRYPLRDRWFKTAYHLDGYRLRTAADFRALGLADILRDPHVTVLIEWPTRARTLLPKKTISISFRHGRVEQERHITARLLK